MKYVPNMFLFYVADIPRSKAFYESLLDITPALDLPTHVAYGISSGMTFAIQVGGDDTAGAIRRNAELIVCASLTMAEMDALFAEWITKGAREVEPPHTEVYGYTFMVADPDGNMIRLAPAD